MPTSTLPDITASSVAAPPSVSRNSHVQLFFPEEALALSELDEAAVPESLLRHGDLQALRFRQRGGRGRTQ
jgi:hypothetical protein